MTVSNEAREALIDAIIADYHTTRLADMPAARHILTKWRSKEAFAAFEARIRTDSEAKLTAAVREALTPSGDTKAAYMGEFKFNVMVTDIDEDNDELVPMQVYVPWTTIKEIMAAIRKRAALFEKEQTHD